ncbi:hypothetical protein M9Y10_022225 [Tritrichomonas musculus]|uniref:Ubiquitin-like domain-containing protein n=1 Tax=Tritrichomonas musculus TaxID=1915356 RepID=A0ABR2KSP5_9EUKA
MAAKVETGKLNILVDINGKVTNFNVADFKDLSAQVEKELNVEQEKQKFIVGGKEATKNIFDAKPDFESWGVKNNAKLFLIPDIKGGKYKIKKKI